MALALNKIWRRYRLAQHGLDPNLVDVIKRKKDARIHEDYIRRYGPRPERGQVAVEQQPVLDVRVLAALVLRPQLHRRGARRFGLRIEPS